MKYVLILFASTLVFGCCRNDRTPVQCDGAHHRDYFTHDRFPVQEFSNGIDTVVFSLSASQDTGDHTKKCDCSDDEYECSASQYCRLRGAKTGTNGVVNSYTDYEGTIAGDTTEYVFESTRRRYDLVYFKIGTAGLYFYNNPFSLSHDPGMSLLGAMTTPYGTYQDVIVKQFDEPDLFDNIALSRNDQLIQFDYLSNDEWTTYSVLP